jgi:hypothetical protein
MLPESFIYAGITGVDRIRRLCVAKTNHMDPTTSTVPPAVVPVHSADNHDGNETRVAYFTERLAACWQDAAVPKNKVHTQCGTSLHPWDVFHTLHFLLEPVSLSLLLHYNSGRVLLSPTIAFHLWWSWTCSVRFISLIYLVSLLTSSSHPDLGLPTGLLVNGFHLYIFLTILVSGILFMCPNQLSLWDLTQFIMFRCFINSSSLFVLDTGLLASSQYPEVTATDHLDTGFYWFPCV